MTPDTITALAAAYDEAERSRVQVRQPTLIHPEMTIADGYAVQREWVRMKAERGDHVIGHKIGLTSRAMQQASQIDEPDYGALLASMVIGDGAVIDPYRFIRPRFEVELGFRLKDRIVGDNVTIFDVMNATDYVAPAIEIIDARCHQNDPESGRPRQVMDTISDNAANAGVIWGGRPMRPDQLDMAWIPGVLRRNGVVEETGVAAGVLGHPANGIVWLARRLAAQGVALEPGQFVLSGSFTRPVAGAPGYTMDCDFGPLGSVTCSIAKTPPEAP
ncbi:MAG: 2-oxo-hepta-3-ene-1,7-dioic acid hydratase [Paracoccaceae bacterium]